MSSIVQTDVVFEGPRHGSDGTTDIDLQYNAQLANEVEQCLLRHCHGNKQFERPGPATKMNKLQVNTNKGIHLLTRAVRPGNPSVPSAPGQSSVVLHVKVPRDKMFFRFGRAAVEKMERGLSTRRRAAKKHREKKKEKKNFKK
jgi:hypothetical protein